MGATKMVHLILEAQRIFKAFLARDPKIPLKSQFSRGPQSFSKGFTSDIASTDHLIDAYQEI